MSYMSLHTLVGTALTDRTFCHDLLNGRRRTLLGQFDLTNEEREAILGVKADSIQDFAAQLCEWLKGRESPVSYPAAVVAVPYPPLRSAVRPAFCQ